MQRLYRPATCLAQLLRPSYQARTFASRRSTRASNARPRTHIDRETGLTNDPEALVRIAHEKERANFRYALEASDFTSAYQIYTEQRELPILSGAEVTSLVQLITADALVRKLNGFEQPDSLKEVFRIIIEDVQDQKVAGQTILWAHALDCLVIWGEFDEAQVLWSHLQSLENRRNVDKNDAQFIDSRVYGSAIKLFTAMGDTSKANELYKEALVERKLNSSLMLEQAMVAAHFQAGNVGEAYRTMDKAIREQRRALRPGFFNAMMVLALDAQAIGVATEIFMKSCKVNMPPAASQVTRLLSELGKSQKSSMDTIWAVMKHYQESNNGRLPVEHINVVIGAIFNSARSGVAETDVLARVHQLLADMQSLDIQPSTSTINILLSGYIQLNQYQLVKDLVGRASLNDVSFRTMLKALAQVSKDASFEHLQQIWTMFEHHKTTTGTEFVLRDLQMAMRAAFSIDSEAALPWMNSLMARHSSALSDDNIAYLYKELEQHKSGRFTHIAPASQHL